VIDEKPHFNPSKGIALLQDIEGEHMKSKCKYSLMLVSAALGVSLFCFAPRYPASAQIVSTGYIQHNLVSDLPGKAITTDPNLKNPWGIAFPPSGPFWISDNAMGVSTLYNGQAQIIPLVVTIPPAAGSSELGTPTGVVFNGTADFVVSSTSDSGPAAFIFATEDGTISGWNPKANVSAAIRKVDLSTSGAVFKGLALVTGRRGSQLFATDFRNNLVRVFDGKFNQVNSFTDPSVPPGFAPFGIANIQGSLFVTFALQEPPDNTDDQKGPGNGFVDQFSPGGVLIQRFASQGTLNSPWGLALAGSFGSFSNVLLVGNFGDGTINVFDFSTGEFLDQLRDTHGQPIMNDGLWALQFGNGGLGGNANVLYFTAGLNDESDGLFGDLQPAQSNGPLVNP